MHAGRRRREVGLIGQPILAKMHQGIVSGWQTTTLTSTTITICNREICSHGRHIVVGFIMIDLSTPERVKTGGQESSFYGKLRKHMQIDEMLAN